MKNIVWMMIIFIENNGVMLENNVVVLFLYCVKLVLVKSKKLFYLFLKSFMSWISVFVLYKMIKEMIIVIVLLWNSEE